LFLGGVKQHNKLYVIGMITSKNLSKDHHIFTAF